jgi:hypothetical protein
MKVTGIYIYLGTDTYHINVKDLMEILEEFCVVGFQESVGCCSYTPRCYHGGGVVNELAVCKKKS